MKKNRWSDIQTKDTLYMVYIAVMISIMIIPLSVATVKALVIVNLSVAFLTLLFSLLIRNNYYGKFTLSIIKKLTIFEISLSVSTLRYIIVNNDSLDEYLISNFSKYFLYVSNGLYMGLDAIIEVIIIILILLYIERILKNVANTTVKFDHDRLPGKLMSIEADFNSDSISQDEAINKKEEIHRIVHWSSEVQEVVIFIESFLYIFIYTVILKFISSILMGVFLKKLGVIDAFLLFSRIIFEDTLELSLPIIFNFASLYILFIKKYKKEKNIW